jgi:hypothetical protein
MQKVRTTKRRRRALAAISTGAVLLVWVIAQYAMVSEFSSVQIGLAALGVATMLVGWLALNRERVGRALQDIAETIDPLVTPPHVDVPEGVDEIHAAGHAHVRRHRTH